jgi:predicted transcriptional regulator
MSSLEIAEALMAAKGMPKDDPQLRRYIADSVLPVMRRLVKRGVVTKTGDGAAARWEIAR